MRRFSVNVTVADLRGTLPATVAGAADETTPVNATAASAPTGAGSAEAGATKAAVCTACHGVNGNSTNPEWPNLAGQNAAYIREQLGMFKAKKRRTDHAANHRAAFEQDFADLAAFFSHRRAWNPILPIESRAGALSIGRPGAQHSGLHRLPRSGRSGQCRCRISSFAPSIGLHREAASGLPDEESLP